jgi:hypothetical protein
MMSPEWSVNKAGALDWGRHMRNIVGEAGEIIRATGMRAWRRPVTRPAASCLLPSGELAVRLFVAGLEAQ